MIFKNLFKKKKWLSEKVSERLAAVAELEIEENGNKAVLHELAFNDGDEKVRRATLDKLNDFSLWWQAFKHDNADGIKKHAENSIIAFLTGQSDKALEPKLKQQFIQECNKSQLLEQVVFKLDDDALALDVLRRLNKDALTHRAILEDALSDSSRAQLLAQIHDVSQLKKLAKKLTGALLDQVEEKIEQARLEAELPIKLVKQARLLLAQLNALKDKQDYDVILTKQSQIQSQWQALQADFGILQDEQKDELNTKYQNIEDALTRILEPIKQAWHAEQESLRVKALMEQNYQDLNQELIRVEGEVTQAVANDVELDVSKIEAELTDIAAKCSGTELTPNHQQELASRCANLLERASKVPQIKAAMVKASELLESLQSLELPNDLKSLNELSPKFTEIKRAWRVNLEAVGLSLPSELNDGFKALEKTWQNKVNALSKEQHQLLSQTRRKLAELESLIRAGKFHSAFGLFKKLGFWMEDLSASQQSQLARKWEKAQEEIEKLHELERSFSNPKKQELLQDIRKLAQHPLADPSEQAHRVRLLRSNWQSLGHAGDEQEQALNQEFDELCEAAFAPCREHYKALEDERNANLKAKELIISQLNTLAENLKTTEVSSWRDLESVFVKLTRLWRETGLVDREKVDKINRQYRRAVAPIREAINQHHKENEEQKRRLLQQATDVAAQDIELSEKTDLLKGLQAKWQKVGFAGKSQDQKLWNEFRAINAPVFEQRDELTQQENQQQQAVFDECSSQFQTWLAELEQANDIGEIRQVLDQAQARFSEIAGLNRGLYEKLRKLNKQVADLADKRISVLRQVQEQQVYIDLFDAVAGLANGQGVDTSGLKPAWQTAINGNNKQARARVTLMLEIAAGLESPEKEKALRNEVQMDMLTEKLEQGIEQDVQALLEAWLGAGIFVQEDLALLDRIKPIFVKQ